MKLEYSSPNHGDERKPDVQGTCLYENVQDEDEKENMDNDRRRNWTEFVNL